MSAGLTARRIAVIGGGIGGLTAALACARHGAKVTVFERATALQEVGAGLQISPNAMRVLDALGLDDAMMTASVRSEAVILRDSVGRQVMCMDLLRHHPDEQFRLIHRARLQDLLAEAAQAAGVSILLGQDVQVMPDGFDLVIGADGIKSRMRGVLNGAETPFFTGQTAWRAVIALEPDAPAASEVFMGPGRHLVSYPLGHGLRNIVAVLERDSWLAEGWSQPGDPAELQAAFSRFCPRVTNWLDQVTLTSAWGLFRHPVAAHWHDGHLAILGDAAHPTLPFMAQGAVMAIEDAWILAACLHRIPDQTQALARYQALRQPRCTRIVDAASQNARNYHLRGPARAVAHAGLRAVGRLAPGKVLSRFSWLYDYDPLGAV